MCQRRENSVQVGQSESLYGGDNQRRLPKVTGICPKGYRRMQASELLDLKDLKSRKQNYGDSKVHCLNRCTLLIKKKVPVGFLLPKPEVTSSPEQFSVNIHWNF